MALLTFTVLLTDIKSDIVENFLTARKPLADQKIGHVGKRAPPQLEERHSICPLLSQIEQKPYATRTE